MVCNSIHSLTDFPILQGCKGYLARVFLYLVATLNALLIFGVRVHSTTATPKLQDGKLHKINAPYPPVLVKLHKCPIQTHVPGFLVPRNKNFVPRNKFFNSKTPSPTRPKFDFSPNPCYNIQVRRKQILYSFKY